MRSTKGITKKIIAMLLAVIMCITSAPMAVLADEVPQILQEEQTEAVIEEVAEPDTEPQESVIEQQETVEPEAVPETPEENSTEVPEPQPDAEPQEPDSEMSTEEPEEEANTEQSTEEIAPDVEQPSTEAEPAPGTETEPVPDTEIIPEQPSTEEPENEKSDDSEDMPEDEYDYLKDTRVNGKKATKKVKNKKKKEEKSKIKVIEVGDLASFTAAVAVETAGDDLTPAYEFKKNSKKVYVHGKEKKMDVKARGTDEYLTVPENVFTADVKVDNNQITDGDGVVALQTVADISDYEVVEQEQTVELINPWQNKRLLVRSPMGFDPKNAVSIIQGYDSMFIITYKTEEDTKAAYEYLLTIPYLTVETDTAITAMTSSMEPVAEITPVTNEEPVTKEESLTETIVAVLDTGYDMNGDITGITGGMDLTGSGTLQDENGHGTALSNLILDHTKDAVNVMPIKVADAEGHSSSLKIYLGIRHAMENGADIINISMTSYKPSDNGIVKAMIEEAAGRNIPVIVAAGNFGENTEDYIPAGIDTAIVVSAVNADKTRNAYSNYGATVDYSASGSVEARGLNSQTVTVSGTSVSAAIVTAVVSGVRAKKGEISVNELTAVLNTMAEDLGDAGRDIYFGNGYLTMDELKIQEEEKTEEIELPELLKCDWKAMDTENLNELIDSTETIYKKRFLDDMSEADRKELLAREDILYNHRHTAVSYNPQFEELARFEGTLREYLYSSFCNEYTLQNTNGDTENSKTFGQYMDESGNVHSCWVPTFTEDYCSINTSLRTTKANVWVSQMGGQPTDTYTVTISATDNGAFEFGNMKITGRFLSGDDNGHNLGTTPFHYSVFVENIKVKKAAHSRATGQSYTIEGSNTYLAKGGFYKKNISSATVIDTATQTVAGWNGVNICEDTTITTGLMIGEGDVKARDASNNHQVFTLNMTAYDTKNGEWQVDKRATCTVTGQIHRQKLCQNCNTVVETGDEVKRDIPAREHKYIADGASEAIIVVEKESTCIEHGKGYCNCLNTDEASYTFTNTNNVTFTVEKAYEPCDYAEQRELPLADHRWTYDYKDCSDIEDENVIVPLGLEYRQCTVCDLLEDISYRQIVYAWRQTGVAGEYIVSDRWTIYDEYCEVGEIVEGYEREEDPYYYAASVPEHTVTGAHIKIAYIPAKYKDIQYSFDRSFSAAEQSKIQNKPANSRFYNGQEFAKVSNSVPYVENQDIAFLYWHTDAYYNDSLGIKLYPGDNISKSNFNKYDYNGDGVLVLYSYFRDVIRITLDNQGADEGNEGTKEIFLDYGKGYYGDAGYTTKITEIEVPKKTETLASGEKREMYFNGYHRYTHGRAGCIANEEGNLQASVNGAADYTFPSSSTTVYANWLHWYKVEYDLNLSDMDKDIILKDSNEVVYDMPEVPSVFWRVQGKDRTIKYEGDHILSVENPDFTDIYRFKGWSLTPDGSSGIVLSDETVSYNLPEADVTLYAQWDTSFKVAYMGNVQSHGTDYLDAVADIEGAYTFNPNEPDAVAELGNADADYFVKTVEKPTVDIETGEALDEGGNPYMETVQCSFQGWSMFNNYYQQVEQKKFFTEKGNESNVDVVREAIYVAKNNPGKGLTIGIPGIEFGANDAPHPDTMSLIAGVYGEEPDTENVVARFLAAQAEEEAKMPYVNMHAIWNEYPQISAYDLHYSLEFAQSTTATTGITMDELLSHVIVTDAEDTVFENVSESSIPDEANLISNTTHVTVEGYSVNDFTGFSHDGSVTVNFMAQDSVGNVTRKQVTIHITDAAPQPLSNRTYTRFISEKYYNLPYDQGGLEDDSLWLTDAEYVATIQEAFANINNNTPEKTYSFTRELIEEMQEYVRINGIGNSVCDDGLSRFYDQFMR